MKKEKHSGDKISEQTLHEILLDIKYRLNHIEDMEADNRSFIVKLIKQGNSIVKFLSSVGIEEDDSLPFEKPKLPSLEKEDKEKLKQLQELVDKFMDKRKDLKELEEELKKNKDMLTPGQLGES